MFGRSLRGKERFVTFSGAFRNARRVAAGALGVAALLVSEAQGAAVQREGAATRSLGALSLPFIRNEGQMDPAVAYYAATFAGTVFVTRNGEIVYALPEGRRGPIGPRDSEDLLRRLEPLPGWSLAESLVGGRPKPQTEEPSAARANFFLGSDPAAWRTGVQMARSVSLGEVWPGIHVSLHARSRTVEKVFTIAPGADPSRIRIRVGGARSLRVDDCGALEIGTGLGPVVLSAPVAYQERDGVRAMVDVAYEAAAGEYGFRLGPHEATLPVVVDPLLQSTFLGGAGEDTVNRLAVHPTSGDVYVAGYTSSPFPGTAGGSQASYGGGNQDGFVARLNADLTDVVQATYLGGNSFDAVNAIAIHPTTGDIYVCGNTTSTDFPGKGGPQPNLAGSGDAFVTKLGADLDTAPVSTYLGAVGNDLATAMAIHPTTGEIYVGGFAESTSFPFTTGYQTARTNIGSFEAWIARLNANLAAAPAPVATWLGGTSFEEIFAIAVTSAGVYVAGLTGSTDFPGTATGAQSTIGGGFADTSAFVSLLNANLTALTRSTYYGADAQDTCFGIAVNSATGDVYITGGTSSLSLPGAIGGAQRVRQGPTDNYVARFNGSLTQLLGATYNGGTGGEGANAIDVNPATGSVYIAGTTFSTRLPGSTSGAQRIYAGGGLDAFVVRFNAALTSVLGATFLGGGPDAGQPNDSGYDEAIALRFSAAQNEVYVAGYTAASDFPKTAGGAQPLRGGILNDKGVDGFVSRLTPDLQALFAPQELVVDPAPGASSDGNLVLEPGETVAAQPSWRNLTGSAAAISGVASDFTGPVGATYTLTDSASAYGSVPAGATRSCTTVPNCFSLSVSDPATRPGPTNHWDVTFIETPTTPDDAPMKWSIHVGDSFTDVPRTYPFYRKVETLFHNGVTLGCTATTYCLNDSVPRVNMAIFIARAIAGGAGFLPGKGVVNGAPYDCAFTAGTSLFSDIGPTDPACPAVHYLAALNVATGCTATAFCPTPNVTRGEMALFMARGVVAPGGGAAVPLTYTDPITARSYSCSAGAPNLFFTDVTATDLYCKHVHYLWAKGIIDGCGGTLYCPAGQMRRDEMAKFLSNSFSLPLYAP